MSLDPKKKAELEEKLRAYVGVDVGPPWVGSDRINDAMIRHWCVVMGDENPVYTDSEAAQKSVHGGLVAPPTMMHTWVMPPYIPPWSQPGSEDAPPANKEVELHQLLSSYGYTGVVATNYDDEYTRYVRLGELISASLKIVSISEEKATPLGVGYFVDVLWDFRDENGEPVGTERFRILKYRPAQPQPAAAESTAPTASATPTRLRPPRGHDNAWWWDAIERDELLIQKCRSCGVLRHPPRAMCGSCQSVEWDGIQASGKGTVYSFTVLHHPKIPGYEFPLVVALIELEEGTRLVANVTGCDASEVEIGMAVRCRIENVDEELKLPMFYPLK
jgi:uncharacterized OB-fold protein/acyl dehydratase